MDMYVASGSIDGLNWMMQEQSRWTNRPAGFDQQGVDQMVNAMKGVVVMSSDEALPTLHQG